MTEYLFRKPQLLAEVINTAIEDNTFRSDDLEFTFAARVSSFYLVLIFEGLNYMLDCMCRPWLNIFIGMVRNRFLRRFRLLSSSIRKHPAVLRAKVPRGDQGRQ